jgi:hypothetical protein
LAGEIFSLKSRIGSSVSHIPARTELPSAENRAAGYRDAALGHHPNEVAIAQPVGAVPANAQLDDFGVEHPSPLDRVTGDRFGHSEAHLDAKSYGKARRSTGNTV